MEEAAPFKATGDHIAALQMVIVDLAVVIEEISPGALHDRLRGVRLFVQGLEAGREQLAEPDGIDAQRKRLALLELCAAGE